MDEIEVRETLGSLDHRAAEERRAKASEEQSSAMGSVGNLTRMLAISNSPPRTTSNSSTYAVQ